MHPSRLAVRSRFPLLILVTLAVALSSCASAPALDKQIYAADQAVTTIVAGTDSALNAGLITKAQAQSVSTIAHQVNPLLDSARAALAASDTTGASKTVTLVNALLAGLQAYVPSPGAAVPSTVSKP